MKCQVSSPFLEGESPILTREHHLIHSTGFPHASSPNSIKSNYPRGTQYIINVTLASQFQHHHIYILKYQCIFVGKNWQKGYTSTRCIRAQFGNYFHYFHNNVPSQFYVPSWTHPSNHIKYFNNNMVRLPYDVNPFGTAHA